MLRDCPGKKLEFARDLAGRLRTVECDKPHPSNVHTNRREAVAAYRHACTNYDELLIELSDFCQLCIAERGQCLLNEDDDFLISDMAHTVLKRAANGGDV